MYSKTGEWLPGEESEAKPCRQAGEGMSPNFFYLQGEMPVTTTGDWWDTCTTCKPFVSASPGTWSSKGFSGGCVAVDDSTSRSVSEAPA